MNDIYGNYTFDGLENWLWKFSKPSVPSYNINTDVRLSVYMYFKNSKGQMIPCPYLDLEKYERNWEYQKYGHIGIDPTGGNKDETYKGLVEGGDRKKTHELSDFCFDLTPFVQSVELPEVGTSAEAKAETQFGTMQVGYFSPWSSDGSVSVTFQIYDTEFSILDAIFYPWLKDIGMSRWYDGVTALVNHTTPFPIATVEIRTPRRRYHPFENNNEDYRIYSYKLIGARPTKFGNFEANMESKGSITRTLTMGCDMVMIDFDKRGYNYDGKIIENDEENRTIEDPNPNPNPPKKPNPEPMMAEERIAANLKIMQENCPDMVGEPPFWDEKQQEAFAEQARNGKPLTKQQLDENKALLRKDEDKKNPPDEDIFGEVPEGEDAQLYVAEVIAEKKNDAIATAQYAKEQKQMYKECQQNVKDLEKALKNTSDPTHKAALMSQLTSAKLAEKEFKKRSEQAATNAEMYADMYQEAKVSGAMWNATNDAAADARTQTLDNAVNTAIDDKFGGGFAADARASEQKSESSAKRGLESITYEVNTLDSEGDLNSADIDQQNELTMPGEDLVPSPLYNQIPAIRQFDFTSVNNKASKNSLLSDFNSPEFEETISNILNKIKEYLTSNSNKIKLFAAVVGDAKTTANSFSFLFNEEKYKLNNLLNAEMVDRELDFTPRGDRDVEVDLTDLDETVKYLNNLTNFDWTADQWKAVENQQAFNDWLDQYILQLDENIEDDSDFKELGSWWETEKLRIPKGISDYFTSKLTTETDDWENEIAERENLIDIDLNNESTVIDAMSEIENMKIFSVIESAVEYIKTLFSQDIDFTQAISEVQELNKLALESTSAKDGGFKSSGLDYDLDSNLVAMTAFAADDEGNLKKGSFIHQFIMENNSLEYLKNFEFIQPFQTKLYYDTLGILSNIEMTDVNHDIGYFMNIQRGAGEKVSENSNRYVNTVFQNTKSLVLNAWNEMSDYTFRCLDVDFILPYNIEAMLLDVCGLNSAADGEDQIDNQDDSSIFNWNAISDFVDDLYNLDDYWKDNYDTRLSLVEFEYQPYELSNVGMDSEDYFDYLYAPNSIERKSRNTAGLSKAEIAEAVAFDRIESLTFHKHDNQIYNVATWKIVDDNGNFTGERWLKAVVNVENGYKVIFTKIDQYGNIIADNGVELDDKADKLFSPASKYATSKTTGSVFISNGIWYKDDVKLPPNNQKSNPTEILYTWTGPVRVGGVDKAKINLAGVIEDDFHPNFCYRVLWDKDHNYNYDEDGINVSLPHYPLIGDDVQPGYLNEEDQANLSVKREAVYPPSNMSFNGSSISFSDINTSNGAEFNMDIICLDHDTYRNYLGGPYGTMRRGFVAKFYNYVENKQKPLTWVNDSERGFTNTYLEGDVFRQNIPDEIKYVRQIPQAEKRIKGMEVNIQDLEIKMHYQEDKLALYYKLFEKTNLLKKVFEQIKKFVDSIQTKIDDCELELDTKCLSWVKIHEHFIELVEEYNGLLESRDEELNFTSDDISAHIENAQKFFQVETELRHVLDLYFKARDDFFIAAIKYLVYCELQREIDGLGLGAKIMELSDTQAAVFNYIMILKESLNTMNSEYDFRLDRYRMMSKRLLDFKGKITALRKNSIYNSILYFDMLALDPAFSGFPELEGNVSNDIYYPSDSANLDEIKNCGWDFTDFDEYAAFDLVPPISKINVETLSNSKYLTGNSIPTSYYYNGYPVEVDIIVDESSVSSTDDKMTYDIDYSVPTYLEDLVINDDDDEETKAKKIINQKKYFNNISMALRIKLQSQIDANLEELRRRQAEEEEAELYRNSLKYDTRYALVGSYNQDDEEERTAKALVDFNNKVKKYVDIMKIRRAISAKLALATRKKTDELNELTNLVERKMSQLKKETDSDKIHDEINSIMDQINNGKSIDDKLELVKKAILSSHNIQMEIAEQKQKDTIIKEKFNKLSKVLVKANEIRSEKDLPDYIYKKILPGFLDENPDAVRKIKDVELKFNDARNSFIQQRENANKVENDLKRKKQEVNSLEKKIKELDHVIMKGSAKVIQLKALRSKIDVVAKRDQLRSEVELSTQSIRDGMKSARAVKEQFNHAQAELVKVNKDIQNSMKFKEQFATFVSDLYDVVFN